MFTILQIDQRAVAVVPETGPRLADPHAVRELMANAHFQGAEGVMLGAGSLPEGFFDLKSGMAGEILQAFSNYRMRLAIVLDIKPEPGSALAAFVLESNRGDLIRFAADEKEALDLLTT